MAENTPEAIAVTSCEETGALQLSFKELDAVRIRIANARQTLTDGHLSDPTRFPTGSLTGIRSRVSWPSRYRAIYLPFLIFLGKLLCETVLPPFSLNFSRVLKSGRVCGYERPNVPWDRY